MGTLVAMIKEMNQWVVIADQIEVEMLDSVDLSDTMRYDPNNQVAHQWFRIENLSQTDYFNNVFNDVIDAGELQTINVDQLDDIKFLLITQIENFIFNECWLDAISKRLDFGHVEGLYNSQMTIKWLR